MTSIGHPIRFGVEILSRADAPDAARTAVEVAMGAEAAGYDVLAFRDQGDGEVDAWTLASWTAARIRDAQIAVTGLRADASQTSARPTPHVPASGRPASTRHASVLARAGASLQLLSGGRAELGVGPVPGSGPQGTGPVTDALAVIHRLLDPTRGPAHHPGEHHHLAGAEPGPVLDRPLPLWIEGSTAEAAALAGRMADGWRVGLDEVGDGGLAGGVAATDLRTVADLSAVVDRAAIEAGRDVREIRRAVTLPAQSAVDVDALGALLVGLVVEQGVRTFWLQVDGTAEGAERARAVIGELAPAVRAAAEHRLPPEALTARPPRRVEVRARRRPGIAYDDLPDSLADTAVEPGDPAFVTVRSTYLRGGSPGLVMRPRTVEQVQDAVAFARTHRHLPLGIRSGGHGISGRSTNDGGLVIDLGALDQITVLDQATRRVRIGPGARWRDVAAALRPHGWALTSGDHGGVGVGGLATAGGIGFLARKHGLTIDHLRAVEVVLADGTLVRADDAQSTELFWAVRGAGAAFGVAVAFEFTADEVDDVGWAQLAFQVEDPAAYLEAFGRTVTAAPRDTTPFLILGRGIAQVMAMVDSDDPEVVVEQLQPFAEIAPLVQQQVVIAPYAAVMAMIPEHPHDGRGEPVSRSALTREITPGFAAASADLLRSGAAHWYQIRSVGGAVADVHPDATAYAHRDAAFSLTVMGADAQRLDRWFEPVRRESDGLYLSFESGRAAARLTDTFPPATLERLRRLKARLDPDNLFRDNIDLGPVRHDPRSAA